MEPDQSINDVHKRLLSAGEAAEYCGVGINTVRKEFWAAEYRFSTAKIRRYDRYLIDEIIDKSRNSR
ncbi:MAG: hypothetical protein E5W83_24450 [Mesorhizobium sp.]|nr:MAG: hypothetical protein E5W83_24450 [Mesorhizobium sp.]